ncbi:FAD binding domain-containing protein [Capillimicrobium parvum]|nr:xanthine dehydrogenase family protein subunit M [Capillimicrobium parvum]
MGYVRPGTVAEAVAELARHDGTARVLAGGQSLVPMMHMRLMRPSTVIDINALDTELGRIEANGSDTLIGALVRYRELETSPVVAERLPILSTIVRHIGDRQVRNRGTVGGALAQADPTGELALACLALGAEVTARSARGERTIPISEFFEGAYASALEPDELLTAVRVPLAPTHCRFFERARKHNDFAVLSVLAMGSAAPDGRWSSVRLALGGVDERPVLATAAAASLEDRIWDDAAIAEAAALALDAIDPPDDVRASAEYRRHLVGVHVRRVLADLDQRGQGR